MPNALSTTVNPDPPRIDESLYVEVLAAAITSPTTATLTILVKGFFNRPGNHVEVAQTVIMATVPATVSAR